MKKSEYIIDTIFPVGEIHLVGGPTGAGKTRWLFDTLLDWQQGRPVLGYNSFPCRWLYVSADRSEASVDRTLKTMNIPRNKIPLVAALDRRMTFQQILGEAENDKSELIVIENFAGFVEPPGMSRQVRSFFYGLRSFIERTGATIIGVMESPKMKAKERYENPRQRIAGVASWGHFAETIVLIEPTDPDKENSNRRIIVCPRNAAEIDISATFENGRLVPIV